jgi:hypothetical protein
LSVGDLGSLGIVDRCVRPRLLCTALTLGLCSIAYGQIRPSELLRLAYEYAESEMDETEPGRNRILAYREDGSFQVDRIEIAKSNSEFDLAYSGRATMRYA